MIWCCLAVGRLRTTCEKNVIFLEFRGTVYDVSGVSFVYYLTLVRVSLF